MSFPEAVQGVLDDLQASGWDICPRTKDGSRYGHHFQIMGNGVNISGSMKWPWPACVLSLEIKRYSMNAAVCRGDDGPGGVVVEEVCVSDFENFKGTISPQEWQRRSVEALINLARRYGL